MVLIDVERDEHEVFEEINTKVIERMVECGIICKQGGESYGIQKGPK